MAGTMNGKRRWPRRVVVLLVIAGLAVGGVAVARSRSTSNSAPPTTAPVLVTAAVKSGDLTTSEKIDGSVVLSATTNVLHRIAGSSTSALSSSSVTSVAAATASVAVSRSALLTEAFVPGCPTGPATTTTSTTTTTTPGSTSTSSSTTSTTTTSTTSTTSTSTTAPDTSPSGPASSTPSTDCPTTTTTPGGGGRGGGGGSGSSGSGSSRSGGSSTGGAGAATRVTQTVTSVIGVGATVGMGTVMYTVDGQPVVALIGALPAWRSLSTASPDGADITQLEQDLVAMGYDTTGAVKVDGHFDSATRTMVKAWQAGLGVPVTGTVALGSIVFVPAPSSVTAVATAVGKKVADGDQILSLATASQQVVIDVPAGDESIIVPGLAVDVAGTAGTVTLLRSATQSGAVVVEAVITPSAPIAGAGNGSAVKVTVGATDVAGVLLVPAMAIASRLDGSYAVEVQAADGTRSWVTVTVLGVSNGTVGIRGTGISAGTQVLIPNS